MVLNLTKHKIHKLLDLFHHQTMKKRPTNYNKNENDNTIAAVRDNKKRYARKVSCKKEQRHQKLWDQTVKRKRKWVGGSGQKINTSSSLIDILKKNSSWLKLFNTQLLSSDFTRDIAIDEQKMNNY